jgi:hypothetical protein
MNVHAVGTRHGTALPALASIWLPRQRSASCHAVSHCGSQCLWAVCVSVLCMLPVHLCRAPLGDLSKRSASSSQVLTPRWRDSDVSFRTGW